MHRADLGALAATGSSDRGSPAPRHRIIEEIDLPSWYWWAWRSAGSRSEYGFRSRDHDPIRPRAQVCHATYLGPHISRLQDTTTVPLLDGCSTGARLLLSPDWELSRPVAAGAQKQHSPLEVDRSRIEAKERLRRCVDVPAEPHLLGRSGATALWRGRCVNRQRLGVVLGARLGGLCRFAGVAPAAS